MTRIGKVTEIRSEMNKLNQKESYFEWKISEHPSLSDFRNSPSFSFAGASWHLEMFLYSGNTYLHLRRESSGSPINLKFSLGLKTKDGRRDSEEYYSNVFNEVKKIFEIEKVYLISFGSDLDSYLGDTGILTVYCTMRELFPKSHAGEKDAGSIQTEAEECPSWIKKSKTGKGMPSYQQKCMDKHVKCSECFSVLKDFNVHICQEERAEGVVHVCQEERSEGVVHVCQEERSEGVVHVCQEERTEGVVHVCQEERAEGYAQTETEKCVFCKDTLEAGEEISSHHHKCMDKHVKCAECCEVVILKDLDKHECQLGAVEASGNDDYQDFKAYMLNGKHSDVTIIVKGEEFPLHRLMLAARNSYFCTMFETDMKETPGVISIDECEPDIFRTFVHFLYLRKLDKLSTENVCALYEAADKYQEDKLKTECLNFMLETLTVDTFCDFISLALKYDEKQLFDSAVAFFISRVKEIIYSTKWKIFVKTYPDEANELIIKGFEFYTA